MTKSEKKTGSDPQNHDTFAKIMLIKKMEAIPELMRNLINNAVQVERSTSMQADQYERTKDCKDMRTFVNRE